MKKNYIYFLFLFTIIFSCKRESNSNAKNTISNQENTTVNFKDITTDYHKWWSYHYNEIILSSSFIAIDEFSEEISKRTFLKKLTSGNYITLELKSKDSMLRYKLFKLNNVDNSEHKVISNTIKNVSKTDLKHFEMEDNLFPEFQFTDIKGNTYNTNNIKGKTTIIKTWFIACKPCIAEFPELNKLVDNYTDKSNIQFISLALDSKLELEGFLKNNPFNYQVVADQESLINELKVNAFPTHIVVNENGVIEKVVAKASELIAFINNKSTFNKSLAPPPPGPISSVK